MSNFQSVIIDCNSSNWGAAMANVTEVDVLREVLSTTLAFCNSHSFSSLNNRLIVLAGGVKSANKKFRSDHNDFAVSLEKFIRQALAEHSSDEESSHSQYTATISFSICAFQKYKKQFPDSTGTILIINLADNLSSEQSTLMNLFFTARHCSMKVDVASLNGAVPILQQACDITDGKHMLIENPRWLGQTILGNCSGTSFINSPYPVFNRPPDNIDYRAVCHCHNQLLDIGWVCSVCLSVTCNFVPFCNICNAIFPRPSQMMKKKN